MQAISVKASSLAESRHTRLSSVFVCCFVSSFRRHSSVMYGSDSRPSACNTRGGGGCGSVVLCGRPPPPHPQRVSFSSQSELGAGTAPNPARHSPASRPETRAQARAAAVPRVAAWGRRVPRRASERTVCAVSPL